MNVNAQSALSLEVVENTAGFAALAVPWEGLAERTCADIFQTFDWLHEWWNHFGEHPRRTLHIIVFRVEGEIAGICPFFIEREQFLGCTVSHKLRLMGCGVTGGRFPALLSALGPSDYLDVLIDQQFRTTILLRLSEHLSSLASSGIDVELEHLSPRSTLVNGLEPILKSAGIRFASAPADICPRMALPSSMEVILRELRPEVRRRVNQAHRASSELYAIRDISSVDELESVLERLIRLHQQRWNTLGYAGLFADERFTRFQRSVLRTLYGKGRIWCKYVEMEGTCVAVRIALRYGRTYYDYLSGFDPLSPASRRRPGIALLLAMMEDGIAAKMETLDFLRGDEEYKFDFANERPANCRLVITLPKTHSRADIATRQFASGIRVAASTIAKEWYLLAIQCKTRGTVSGTLSYLRFRTQRLRLRTAKAAVVPDALSGGLTRS